MSETLDYLARHGTCAPQPKQDWAGDMPLPPSLADYYEKIGPKNVELPWHGNALYLPGLKGLWDFQAGYRWNAITGTATADWPPDWPPDWIVIAQTGGDPFIFDAQTGHVLHALAGGGDWARADDLFNDICSFIRSVTTLSAVYSGTPEIYDDDFNLNPQSVETAREKLIKIVGSLEQANHVLQVLGWL